MIIPVNIFDSGLKNDIMYLIITIGQRIYTHICLLVIDAVMYRMMMFERRNAMTHYMNLASLPFEQIVSGAKTIELRLYDEKRQAVSAGDTIIFTNLADKHQISAKVLKLYIFDSFKELYNNLPLNKCGYAEQDLDSASPDDMLAYYPKEKQERYKVVGIEIELIS